MKFYLLSEKRVYNRRNSHKKWRLNIMEVKDILNRMNYPFEIRKWLDKLLIDSGRCDEYSCTEKERLYVLDEFWCLSGNERSLFDQVNRIELLELFLIEEYPNSKITDSDRLGAYISLLRNGELFLLKKFIDKNLLKKINSDYLLLSNTTKWKELEIVPITFGTP